MTLHHSGHLIVQNIVFFLIFGQKSCEKCNGHLFVLQKNNCDLCGIKDLIFHRKSLFRDTDDVDICFLQCQICNKCKYNTCSKIGLNYFSPKFIYLWCGALNLPNDI